MNSQITKYILSLMKIKGVGPVFIKKRLNIFKSHQNDMAVFKENFYLSLSKKEKEIINLEMYLDDVEKILDECLTYNIIIIEITNDLYPKNLLELKDPPPVLFCKGNISLLEKQIIGIIGTRKATNLGKKIANKVGCFFSNDFAITNGLVDGIDKYSIIHDNKVYSNVIGILSGGLNFNFTSSLTTQELAKKVLDNNGLLISELAPNKKEETFSGSKSSRIQAGLSNVLILVQSSIDGGSKYTLNSFKDLKRTLAVINFIDNKEFNNSETFSANRLIVSDHIKGLSFICEKIKNKRINLNEDINLKKIKLKKIIDIQSKNDYSKIIDDLLNIELDNKDNLFTMENFLNNSTIKNTESNYILQNLNGIYNIIINKNTPIPENRLINISNIINDFADRIETKEDKAYMKKISITLFEKSIKEIFVRAGLDPDIINYESTDRVNKKLKNK